MMKRFFLIIFLTLVTMAVNAQEKETMVVLTTEYGTMKIKLYNETPQHRDNFPKVAAPPHERVRSHDVSGLVAPTSKLSQKRAPSTERR